MVSNFNDDEFETTFPIIVKEWGKYSLLEDSLELIKQIERDQIGERSILAIASRLSRLDPEYSWDLILSIQDKLIQDPAIKDFATSIGVSDPDHLRKVIEETEASDIRYELIWWFYQAVPVSGRFDLNNDFSYLQKVSNEKSRVRILGILELLISNMLNPKSSVSKQIDRLELAEAIEDQEFIDDKDRLRFVKSLRGES